jgi:hypothetical protein
MVVILMVLINYIFDYKGACWADGYIPERKDLVGRLQYNVLKYQPDRDYRSLLERIEKLSDDDLMSETIGFVKAKRLNPKWVEREGGHSVEDVFYMARTGKFATDQRFSTIHATAGRERERQVITIYPLELTRPMTSTRQLLRAAGFRLRPREEIRNFERYKEAVVELLEEVTEIYTDPASGVKNTLNSIGFRTTIVD